MTAKLQDRAFRARLEAAFLKGAKQVGVVARDDIRRSINTSNADGSNPSAPGDPPNKVTQTLSKSIAEVTSRQGGAIVSNVGSNVPYARHLEFGTSKMAARPFLRPALQKIKQEALGIIQAVVRREVG